MNYTENQKPRTDRGREEGTDTAAQGICGGCEEKPDSTVEQY